MIKFNEIGEGNLECVMNLDSLFTDEALSKFNYRWEEFLASDEANSTIFHRCGNQIIYPHKSWLPQETNHKPSVVILLGNSASHSVKEDIYFSFEGDGQEHRFWKVFRELGYIDINTNPKSIKQDFFNLNYISPFRLGLEVIYTFPSSASKRNWAGVSGIERLFGRNAMRHIIEFEKLRLLPRLSEFTKGGGAVIAMQKNAWTAVAQSNYTLQQARTLSLMKRFGDSALIFGTPPTRNLYSSAMKELLGIIKVEILNNYIKKNRHFEYSLYIWLNYFR